MKLASCVCLGSGQSCCSRSKPPTHVCGGHLIERQFGQNTKFTSAKDDRKSSAYVCILLRQTLQRRVRFTAEARKDQVTPDVSRVTMISVGSPRSPEKSIQRVYRCKNLQGTDTGNFKSFVAKAHRFLEMSK